MSAPGLDYVDSYYRRNLADHGTWPVLEGETEAEVCVIGGGLAGLNTALGLAERGRSVVLLEANRVGWGASGRNGGFVSPGFALSATALAERVGAANARELYALTQQALALIRIRIDRHAFDCGPIEPGIVIARWHGGRGDMRPYVDFMRDEMGAAVEHWPAERLGALYASDCYEDGAFDREGFHLNALNFTRGIATMAAAAGARLHEGSAVEAVTGEAGGFDIRTAAGRVRADHVVCCMSGYIGRGIGGRGARRLAAATLPVATYVMLTEPLGEALGAAIRAPHAIADTRFAGDYYRALPDGRILWGGRVSAARRPPRRLAALMQRDLLKVYPQLHDALPAVAWDGLMGYARHKMPQIGRLAPGFWYCMGFGGKGMCATTMGGELIATAIADGDERWRLFAPFTLGYAGGPLGPLIAGTVYGWYKLRDSARV